MQESPVIQQVLDFVRAKLLEFEVHSKSGVVSIDVTVAAGEAQNIDCRSSEKRKVIKTRDRFPK